MRSDPRYGRGEHTLEVFDARGLAFELQRALRDKSFKPPSLPAVALKIFELSRQNDAGCDQLAQVLASDPILAAEVLRVA